MNIRPYNSADRQACINIFNSNCEKYFDPSELKGLESWLDDQDNGTITTRASISDYYYVGEVDQKVIASGGFYIYKEKPVASMTWGMVDNAYHKKGIGKELFEYRMTQIQELYPDHSIILDTTQHTFQFFERFGFKVVKITPNGYGHGLDRYDMKL